MEQFLASAEVIAADPPAPAAATDASAEGGSDGDEEGGESAAGAASGGVGGNEDADDEAAVSILVKCLRGVGGHRMKTAMAVMVVIGAVAVVARPPAHAFTQASPSELSLCFSSFARGFARTMRPRGEGEDRGTPSK